MFRLTYIFGLILAFTVKGKAQVNFESQIGSFAHAIPSFFHAYSDVVQDNLAVSMMLCHQMQHGNDDWKLKYSFAMSATPLSTSNAQNLQLNTDRLSSSQDLRYYGSYSNIFGTTDKTNISTFLLNEEGERIVNPKTGEFVSIEAEMLGGLGRNMAFVPAFSPFLEWRVYKGIILSAAYFPISYLLRDFKTESFTPNVNFYAAGLSLHLNYFTDVAVLKWLRFEGNYNLFDMQMNNVQEVFNLSPRKLFDADLSNMKISNQYAALQIRSSIAVPVSKKFYLIGQYSLFSLTQNFNFDFDLNVAINEEELKNEYNIVAEEAKFSVKERYNSQNQEDLISQLSAGLLFQGQVGTLLLNVTNYPILTIAARASIKIL